MEPKLEELKTRLLEINDITSAAALLRWDQSTYMPRGGGPARGRQIATLQRLAQEKFTDDAIGHLLDDLRPFAESQPYDSDEAGLIRVTRRDYGRAVKVPPEFTARFATHSAASYQAWATARPANDFAAVRPFLEKTLDLSREYANFFPGYDHIADPLIDPVDEGMQAASVRRLFADLRSQLVPIVQAITSQEPADDSCLRQPFPEAEQWQFCLDVARQFGYDLERGRMDATLHPFAVKFSIGDVRITTRTEENDLNAPLFPTLHESGHAMYEQGVNPAYEGSPLARGASSGVHESQSRLWENLVGRSRGFWQHYYPRLQGIFPGQLGSVPLDTFYRAVNKVQPSLIRVKADEVTYNLHVMLRFDCELDLLEGNLEVKDLPEAWHERMQSDLGVEPPDDRHGVLQDVHWYSSRFGGVFQGYTIGNVLSAQFFEAATRAHPEIPEQITQGEFGTLHGWLKDNIYRHGRKYRPDELIERVTGGPMTIDPYIRYLRGKFGELYAL